MTSTPKTPKKTKALTLTSRAKMGAARKARKKPAAAPAQPTPTAPATPAVHPVAQDTSTPSTEQPAPAERLAPDALGTLKKASLEREPGRGWHHVVIDGKRVGAVFVTTRKGARLWAAETPDRGLRAEGANRQEAVEAFVASLTQR
jgi:hypothetical protein